MTVSVMSFRIEKGKLAFAVFGTESCTVIDVAGASQELAPPHVGVPDITPVDELMLRPAGKFEADHV
jgi:hypothetical protein